MWLGCCLVIGTSLSHGKGHMLLPTHKYWVFFFTPTMMAKDRHQEEVGKKMTVSARSLVGFSFLVEAEVSIADFSSILTTSHPVYC